MGYRARMVPSIVQIVHPHPRIGVRGRLQPSPTKWEGMCWQDINQTAKTRLKRYKTDKED